MREFRFPGGDGRDCSGDSGDGDVGGSTLSSELSFDPGKEAHKDVGTEI